MYNLRIPVKGKSFFPAPSSMFHVYGPQGEIFHLALSQLPGEFLEGRVVPRGVGRFGWHPDRLSALRTSADTHNSDGPLPGRGQSATVGGGGKEVLFPACSCFLVSAFCCFASSSCFEPCVFIFFNTVFPCFLFQCFSILCLFHVPRLCFFHLPCWHVSFELCVVLRVAFVSMDTSSKLINLRGNPGSPCEVPDIHHHHHHQTYISPLQETSFGNNLSELEPTKSAWT